MRLETKGPAGQKITVTAPTGGYTGGQIIAIRTGTSGKCGVVLQDTPAGGTAVVHTQEQILVPKNTGTGTGLTQGDVGYLDNSTGNITDTATGNHRAGTIAQSASAADTHVWMIFE